MNVAKLLSLCVISASCSDSRYALSLSLIFNLPAPMAPSWSPVLAGFRGPLYGLFQYFFRNSARGVYATWGSTVAR